MTLVTALHLLDAPAALSEAVRVCRAGGRVVLTLWAADDLGTPPAATLLAQAAGLSDVVVLQGPTTAELLVVRGRPSPASGGC